MFLKRPKVALKKYKKPPKYFQPAFDGKFYTFLCDPKLLKTTPKWFHSDVLLFATGIWCIFGESRQ